MIAFPEMLVGCAKEAGITIPSDVENYEPEDFMHWHIFLMVQLGQSLPYPSAHWDNAKVVSALKDEELKTVTMQDLIEKGLSIGNSSTYY